MAKRGRPRKNPLPTTDPTKIVQSVYDVSLRLNEKEYSAKGNTLEEAFDQYGKGYELFAKGVIVKTMKNALTVRYGGNEQTEILTGHQIRRFFINPTFRKLIAKMYSL